MRFLITGAGLIGSAIARRLLPEFEVVLFDRAPGGIGGEAPPGAVFVAGDIRDRAALEDAMTGAHGVFHTAALHGIHLGSHPADDFMSINVAGTFNVLEAAVTCGATRVVFSSTVGVFGTGATTTVEPETGRPRVTDATPSEPTDVYGLSKALSEQLCAFYRAHRGLKVVSLRYGAVRQLVERATGELSLQWATSGALTDVDDAVAANLTAMFGTLPPRLVYNIMPPTGSAPTRIVVEGSATEADLGLEYRWPAQRLIDRANTSTQGTSA